jgi:(1->4)-alpha-D-glucan 1-alpha-D-glucosylmutase
VVEKILTRDEPLPADWTVDGTVGYEFLNALNGLFVDPGASSSILATYREFTAEPTRFPAVLFNAKRLITRSSLASERNMLAVRLARIAARDRRSRDFTRAELGRALGAIMATFPVYRTYLRPGGRPSRFDRRTIERAVSRARKRNPTIDESVFAFVRGVLLMEHPDGLPREEIDRREAFAVRFQQTTGPVQAKGLEDTTFYRYVPLVSLNEVGGDPSRFGISPAKFHARNARRLRRWPEGLLATATHDTKRGEDARIRINALSEMSHDWAEALARWTKWNAGARKETPRGAAPDAREEYLFYQALLGSWPFGMEADGVTADYVARLQEYVVKAAREAKVKTSWTDADPTHPDALRAFVASVLTGTEGREFREDFHRFQRRVARVGIVHSLSQALLKLTSPGVPDIYQGSELWDLNLVDPDNRRPVDFDLRAGLLGELRSRIERGESRGAVASSLLSDPHNGAVKLYLIWTVLNHRREEPDLYRRGEYVPLKAEGPYADRLVAYARRGEGRSAIVIAPRLVSGLMGEDGTRMPLGEAWESTNLVIPTDLGTGWSDRLTGKVVKARGSLSGRSIPLAGVLDVLPVALLESASSS